MRWVVVVLVAINALVVGAVMSWSPPGKLDVEGGRGKLPRVSDLRIEQTEAREASLTSSSATARAEPASGTADGGVLCGRIDGFTSEVLAQAFARAHRDWLDRERVVRQAASAPAYHWVLIPPLPTKAAALRRLEELQRGGIDSFLVTEGEYRNAISLGLFESEKLAQDLNARFQSRNVETVLVNTDRNQISYALVFAAASKADLSRLVEAARRDAGDLNVVKNAPCEGVASPDKSP